MQIKGKILAVDANLTNLAVLEELLRDEFNLRTAETGEEALEVAHEFRPDLILLDIMMPGIDGYEVCRRLRADSTLRHTKVVMVSAKATVSERLKGYSVGANDYVVKPFEEYELLAKVRVYLRLKSVEEVDQLKSNALNLLGHETRTPLSLLIIPAETLMSNANMDADKQKTLIEIIYRNAKRLHRLFERIVTLCAMKSGKCPFNPEPANLSDVTHEATDKFMKTGAAGSIRIKQQFDTNPVVSIDTGEISMVVTSLLDNAVHFSPPYGVVTICVSSDNGEACLSVTDHGQGIEPDFLPYVFDEFSSIDASHHSEGQGLSLATARQVVLHHNGAISAESTKAAGTTFTIRLPITPNAQAKLEESVFAPDARAEDPSQSQNAAMEQARVYRQQKADKPGL